MDQFLWGVETIGHFDNVLLAPRAKITFLLVEIFVLPLLAVF